MTFRSRHQTIPPPLAPLESLAGLHAKAYVVDRQSGSHLIVGSANATVPAFGGNVEFLVEFEGPRTKFGVAALLGEQARLRALTIPYEPVGGDEVIPPDELADHALDQVLRELASRRYFAQVEAEEPDIETEGAEVTPHYRIRLSADGGLRVPDGMKTRACLLTRPRQHRRGTRRARSVRAARAHRHHTVRRTQGYRST